MIMVLNQPVVCQTFSPNDLLEHIADILPYLYLYLLYMTEMLFILHLALKFKYPSGRTTAQCIQED